MAAQALISLKAILLFESQKCYCLSLRNVKQTSHPILGSCVRIANRSKYDPNFSVSRELRQAE